MPEQTDKASQIPKGEGRKLRRARNVIKRVEQKGARDIMGKYYRAVAQVTAARLSRD